MSTLSGFKLKGIKLNVAGVPSVVWVSPQKSIGPYGSDLRPSKDVNVTLLAKSNSGFPITYELVSGSLPEGVTLDGDTGKLTGTITGPDAFYPLTFRATSGNLTVDKSLKMIVGNAPPPYWVTSPGLLAGVNEFDELNFQLEAIDPNELPVFYFLVGGGLPPGLFLNPDTGMIYGTVDEIEFDNEYFFTVSASNNSRAVQRTFSIYVMKLPNENAPVWITPSGQLGEDYWELSEYDFTVHAVDPLGGTIAYLLSGGSLPPGISIDPDSGELTGTLQTVPDDTLYRFILGAYNGMFTSKRLFYIQIKHDDDIVWDDNDTSKKFLGKFLESTPVDSYISAGHNNELTVTFTLTGLPEGLTFDVLTGEIKGTMPINDQEGDYDIDLVGTATDGLKTIEREFFMTNEKNLPPVFVVASELGTDLAATDFFGPIPLAIDPNGMNVTYRLLNPDDLPDTLSFDAITGNIFGTFPPANTEDTQYLLSIEANDGVLVSQQDFVITSLFNTPPIWQFSNVVDNYDNLGLNVDVVGRVVENTPISFAVHGYDPQNKPVTYIGTDRPLTPDLDTLRPDNFAFDRETHTIYGYANASSDGAYYALVNVALSDGVFTNTATFAVEVIPDLPPYWITNGGVVANVLAETTINIPFEAEDPQGQELYYEILDRGNLPADRGPGVAHFEVTPTGISGQFEPVDEDTTYTFTFRVTDIDGYGNINQNHWVAATFSIFVRKNTPPVWVTGADQPEPFEIIRDWEGNAVSFQLDAYDPEGVPITYFYSETNTHLYDITIGDESYTMNIGEDGLVAGVLPPNITEDTWWDFTVSAWDNSQPKPRNLYRTPKTFRIYAKFNTPPVWLSKSDLGRVEGLPFSYSFNATGDGNQGYIDYRWVSGSLPDGVEFISGRYGMISGIMPAVDQDTEFNFTIEAWNGIKGTNKSFVLTVYKQVSPMWITAADGIGSFVGNTSVSANLLAYDDNTSNIGGQLQHDSNHTATLDNNNLFGLPNRFALIDRSEVPETITFTPVSKSTLYLYEPFNDLANFTTITGIAEIIQESPFEHVNYNNSVSVDSSSTLSRNFSVIGNGNFTITMWIKREDGSDATLLTITNSSTAEESLNLSILDNRPFLTINGNAGTYIDGEQFSNEPIEFNSSETIPVGEWVMLGVQKYVGTDGGIRWDAGFNETKTSSSSASGTDATTLTNISGNQLNIGGFAGEIDELIAYRYATDYFQPAPIGGRDTYTFEQFITGHIGGKFPIVEDDETYTFSVRVDDHVDFNERAFEITNEADKNPIWGTPAGALPSVLERYEYDFTLSAHDPEGNALVYSYTISEGSLPFDFDTDTARIHGTAPLSADAITTYDFTVTASDGTHTTDRSFSIDIHHDYPPQFVTPAGRIGYFLAGKNNELTIVATDPNNTPLTFTIMSGDLPSGISFSSEEGQFRGMYPLSYGADQIIQYDIQVSDGINNVIQTFEVLYKDNQPAIGPTTGGVLFTEWEQTFVEFDPEIVLEFADPNQDELTVHVTAPAWVTYTVDQIDAYTANIVVVNANTPVVLADQSFNFSVATNDGVNNLNYVYPINVKFNSPPIWVTSPTLPASSENQPYGPVTLLATSNGKPVFYSIVSGVLPGNLTLDVANGIIQGSTTGFVTDDQTFTFTVLATTGIKASTRTFSIFVKNNEPPVWPALSNLGVYNDGTQIPLIVLKATDPNGDMIDYSIQNTTFPYQINTDINVLQSGVNTVQIYGNAPVVVSPTTYTLKLGADDGFIKVDKDYTLTVVPTPEPAWLTNNNIGSFYDATNLSITLTALGSALPLTYTNTSAMPTGLNLVNGVVTGMIPVGTYTNASVVTFDAVVTDINNRSNARTFSMTVLSPIPVWNTPANLNNTSFTEEVPINYQLNATSISSFTYSAVGGMPTGLTLQSNGLITGSITGGAYASDGTINFTVAATDAAMRSNTRTFAMNVVTVYDRDPNIADVRVLLNMEQTTTPVELSGGVGTSSTSTTNCRTTSTRPKWQSKSLEFDGSTNYVQVQAYGQSTRVTIECWIYMNNLSAARAVFGNYNVSSGTFFLRFGANGKIAIDGRGSSYLSYTGTGTYAAGQWHHVALVRNGNTCMIFVNGNLEIPNAAYFDATTPSQNIGISVGYNPNAGVIHNGFIDDFRISHVARYTSAFTPPTKPFDIRTLPNR